MLNMPESLAVLKGHTGLVKGIAWDPIGKYIASQSDDKTVRVWKTADWKQESVVSEPFEEVCEECLTLQHIESNYCLSFF